VLHPLWQSELLGWRWMDVLHPMCTENLIRVDDVMESLKLAE
jgi:hypothetical protein